MPFLLFLLMSTVEKLESDTKAAAAAALRKAKY